MLLRVAFGVGLLALGYYVGREMGRNESLRRELEGDQGRGDLGPEAGPAPPVAEDLTQRRRSGPPAGRDRDPPASMTP